MKQHVSWIIWLLAYTVLVTAGCLPLLSDSASPSATAVQPAADTPTNVPDPAAESFAVLVFSKTAGFRHASIPDGIVAIQDLGAQYNFTVDATEDSTRFTDEALTAYRVVVFLNTTGDVLNTDQQAAFERFIQRGGGFVGIHAASDTEYDWPWYGQLVGAYFASHPAIQPATLVVVDPTHRSTRPLPTEWPRIDEWYNFQSPPAPEVNVLVRLDETTYEGGTMGDKHPISWYHDYAGGRAWYTAMGHTSESYGEPLFRDHIAGGVLWAAGETEVVRVALPLITK